MAVSRDYSRGSMFSAISFSTVQTKKKKEKKKTLKRTKEREIGRKERNLFVSKVKQKPLKAQNSFVLL